MRRIGIKKTAAIGTQLLNRFLRSNRSHSNSLLCPFDGLYIDIRIKVLDNTLRNQQQCCYNTNR